MSILKKLFEYEDPSMRGIHLASALHIEYDPSTSHHHHRYHRTKAGLYVVLRHHPDGRIQRSSIGEGMATHAYPELDHQLSQVENSFFCESLEKVSNPHDEKGSICRSTTRHSSGLKCTHAVDGNNGQIVGVNLRAYTDIEEKLFGRASNFVGPVSIPAWQIEVTKYEEEISCIGRIYDLQQYNFGSLGSLGGIYLTGFQTVALPLPDDLTNQKIDYEASINAILAKIPEESTDNSTLLKCLVFKPDYYNYDE